MSLWWLEFSLHYWLGQFAQGNSNLWTQVQRDLSSHSCTRKTRRTLCFLQKPMWFCRDTNHTILVPSMHIQQALRFHFHHQLRQNNLRSRGHQSTLFVGCKFLSTQSIFSYLVTPSPNVVLENKILHVGFLCRIIECSTQLLWLSMCLNLGTWTSSHIQ